MAKIRACERCRIVQDDISSNTCQFCGGSVRSCVVTKAQEERILYGGLSKKKYEHMMKLANNSNTAFREFMRTHEGTEKEKLALWRHQQTLGGSRKIR